MRINKDSLSVRVLNIVKEKGISANVVYSRYFFDCFHKLHSRKTVEGMFSIEIGETKHVHYQNFNFFKVLIVDG